MTGLVPNRLLFDFELPLRYRKVPPSVTGALDEWDDGFLLPDLCRLDGRAAFAPVYAAWNEDGIYVATRVTGKRRSLICNPKAFWKSDHLRVCIDTRDARANKRATRFCHQFYLLPAGGGPKGDRPAGGSHKIQRAREDAPSAPPGRVRVGAQVDSTGYTLDAHIPSDCLNGFDPVEHPRIGFYYILEDHDHGQQYLTVGDDLYWYVDPSTWATGVLTR
ncbi:MAG TPA: hypothetical protein VM243_09350 [Phycisphaerae bacterium]|nr:hypothetical protein [Phycisphaerae bacterium]